MKKIILSLILVFLFSSNTFAFEKGLCSKDLIIHQNLRGSKVKYIKNGRYDWYTRGIVKEAHILQKHLNRLGFNAGPVDGIIGPKTRGAILRLQKYLGTIADGYVGPKTRALLNNSCGNSEVVKKEIQKKQENQVSKINQKIDFSEIASVLEKGVSDKVAGGDVLKLQKFLKSKGYEINYLDGIFGNEVERALKKFTQKELGREENYFDPRWFWKKENFSEKNWKSKKIKEYLGYGKFDLFYLDFPFEKEKIKSIYCGKTKKDFIFKNGKIFFPVSKNGYGKFTCKINVELDGKNKTFDILDVYFREVKRPTTHVTLTKKYATGPSTTTQKRIAAERKMLREIYQKADKKAKFNSNFERPMNSKIISPFGKVRIFNGGRKSVHSGTDFRARTPLSVKAINDGEVILANFDLYYCGKGIIVNHGMNIFSTYCHLSRNNVKVGDKVKKGQVIGLSGATGRVSGPHLHLSVKYNGGYIDFEDLEKSSRFLR